MEKLSPRPILDLAAVTGDQQLFFFIDNAGSQFDAFDELMGQLHVTTRFTFLLADQPHIIRPRMSRARFSRANHIQAVPPLDRADTERILDKLTHFGFLGALAGKPRNAQLHEFLIRSRKQLLVALKEATSGKGFDVILASEFANLADDSAKLAYAIACLAYMHGAPVRRRHLLACVPGTDVEKAQMLSDSLREVLVPHGPGGEFLIPRHRVIARHVALEATPHSYKKEALISYLCQVSSDVTPDNISRRTPEYVGYRGMVNFDNICDLFGQDYDVIRDIYEEIRIFYSRDFLFWLQYARAELNFDNFEKAENFLNQSLGIREKGNFQAHHQLGLLHLKRARYQETAPLAASDAKDGETILRGLIAERGDTDSYPYAALLTYKLRYLQKWHPMDYSSQLEELHQLSRQAVSKHPFSEVVAQAAQEVTFAYLLQAVRHDHPETPDAPPEG